MIEANVIEATASMEELEALIVDIENVLVNKPRSHVIMALISMSLIAMNPMITPESLQTGVRDVSQFICMLMDEPSQLVDAENKILMN